MSNFSSSLNLKAVISATAIIALQGNIPMRICTHPGCDKRHRAKGYCITHLHRFNNHGDPDVVKYKRHGLDRKTYNVWHSMMERCTNPKDRAFANYGGRGIVVCERWHEFLNFYEDMGKQPPGLTVERRNNDLGYCPENCEWATRQTQQRNRRCNRLTLEDARAIRERCGRGELQRIVAADYGLSPAYVSAVVTNRVWREDPIRSPV